VRLREDAPALKGGFRRPRAGVETAEIRLGRVLGQSPVGDRAILAPCLFCVSFAAAGNLDARSQVSLPNDPHGLWGAPPESPFMTVSNLEVKSLTPSEHQVQLRRAVIASTIGTAIEWYDFFLYSTVTGLVFAKLFFPHSDPWVGTLEAFAIYAVGFVARPIGAAIFGHYGDRIGRKSTLIATLLLMGVATFAVALVPTYESIGIWGAVILTVLRFIQGVGVGGEWGG
jgi:hypothetical protein